MVGLRPDTRFVYAKKILREKLRIGSTIAVPKRLPYLEFQSNEEAQIFIHGTIRLFDLGPNV